MSTRTEWGRVHMTGVDVVDEYEDAYGQGLDEGGIALVVWTDEALVLEAVDTDAIREFATKILNAANDWDLRKGEED